MTHPQPFSRPEPLYGPDVPAEASPAGQEPVQQQDASTHSSHALQPDEPAQHAQPEQLPGERSPLLAAFDALSGPVFPSSEDEQQKFRTEFNSPVALPSRSPRKSWSEVQAAAAIESPAGDLFGTPGDGPKHRANLSDAFADFGDPPAPKPEPPTPTRNEPPTTTEPPLTTHTTPPTTAWNETPVPSRPSPTPRDEAATAGWNEASLPSRPSPAPRSEPTSARWNEASVASKPSPTPRTDATTGGWNEASLPSRPSPALRNEPTTPAWNEASATLGEWSTRPSGAEAAPSTASSRPTYDEPIGPQLRPHGRPRRGERSATTIASLLTEALAAYQSSTDAAETAANTATTTDEQDEPARRPGDPATAAGRHRSPE